jgi:hypothetical protein
MKVRDHLEDLGTDGKIILKFILQKDGRILIHVPHDRVQL